MSWLKETFDFFGKTNDPFLKFMWRLTIVVLFVVLAFFGYSIVTGKKIQINGGVYGVEGNDKSKGDSSQKNDTNKSKISKSTQNIDSWLKTQHENDKKDSILLLKYPINNDPINEPGGKNKLTDTDLIRIDNNLKYFIEKAKRYGTPDITVFYDTLSEKIGLQVYKHCQANYTGIKVSSGEFPDKFEHSVNFALLGSGVQIDIGSFNNKIRTFDSQP